MSLLLATLLAAAVRVESVTVRPVDGRPGLVVVAEKPLPPAVVSRSGDALQVRLAGARLSKAYAGPRQMAFRTGRGKDPAARSLRLVPTRDGLLLHLRLAPEVPFGVHQEGRVLRLSFGVAQVGATRGRSLIATAGAEDGPPPPPPSEGSGPAGRPLAPRPATSLAAAAKGAARPEPVPPPAAFAALRGAGTPLAVVVEPAGEKALVVIRGGAGLADARVRREGGEVIVTFDVGALAVPASPEAVAPVDEVHVEKVATLAVVHVKVAPEVPFEVARETGRLVLTFGEEAALDKIAPPPPPPAPDTVDVQALVSPEVYRGLFPASLGGTAEETAAVSDFAREGLQVGSVNLRPSILVSFVDGEYTVLDSPVPVNDRYLQIEPRVAADTPLLGGELTAEYAIRLRYFSAFEEINTTSHLLTAGFETPLGSRTLVRLRDHFSTGVLESTEVDPGQEYFFDLARFRRNDVELGARVDAGARLFLDGALGYNNVRYDDPGGFFPYETRSARLGAGLTLGDNLRGGLYYGYERIPAPAERPVVASTAHSLGVSFEGDFSELTRGRIDLDYRNLDAPQAAAGGQSYEGFVGTLSLTRQLGPTSQLTLLGRRATDLSAFEQNAFYVSTGGQAQLSFGLPWSLSANTGVGYQENHYKTESPAVGGFREDSIFGWTAGLSRPLGTFAFVRADYRRDRRRSNLPGFDLTTDGFVVQMGMGLFGSSVRR